MPAFPGEKQKENPYDVYVKWLPYIMQWEGMRGGPEQNFQLLRQWRPGGYKDQEAWREKVYFEIKIAFTREYNRATKK